jgi:protein subunit release factor B
VNKVSSAASIRHCPTGLAVTASESCRSQAENRHLALSRLLDLLERHAEQRPIGSARRAGKRRRQNAHRSRRAKAKLVEGKRCRGEEVKRLREKSPTTPKVPPARGDAVRRKIDF